MHVIRSLLVWLCFIPVAILNGGLRQYVLDQELLSAYNPMTGNLWLLVVITTFGAPRLVYEKERR